jgi:hypothetical protein
MVILVYLMGAWNFLQSFQWLNFDFLLIYSYTDKKYISEPPRTGGIISMTGSKPRTKNILSSQTWAASAGSEL